MDGDRTKNRLGDVERSLRRVDSDAGRGIAGFRSVWCFGGDVLILSQYMPDKSVLCFQQSKLNCSCLLTAVGFLLLFCVWFFFSVDWRIVLFRGLFVLKLLVKSPVPKSYTGVIVLASGETPKTSNTRSCSA